MRRKRKYYRITQGKTYKIIKFKGKIVYAALNGKRDLSEYGRKHISLTFLVTSILSDRFQPSAECLHESFSLINTYRNLIKNKL